MSQAIERCSIIVVGRDRFSTTVKCLDTLIAKTKESYDLIVVLGGAPGHVRKDLEKRYGTQARLIFTSQFLNPSESRNLGLREAKTPLAVLMDNDVNVWPGWLEPLIACQRQTGAAMVVPIILEGGPEIHTAGNDFYISYENGKAFAHKELRYRGMIIGEGNTNLKRQRTDYGELHCQLIEVETALKLNAYDEHLREISECDSGLTWIKAGREMWFEPRSIVNYAIPGPIQVEDIKFFSWKWDMRALLEGYQYFYGKWNIDITEHGEFRDWLLRYNHKLGFLPRFFPSSFALFLDSKIKQFSQIFLKILMAPIAIWRRFRAWRLGYYEWEVPTKANCQS